jgi:hypothetical protein
MTKTEQTEAEKNIQTEIKRKQTQNPIDRAIL